MRLCLLFGRRCAPYGKWLGSAFKQLPVAGELSASLQATLAATGYRERAKHLCEAYEVVAVVHNESGLTPSLATTCRRYHGRPYRVLFAERFANALVETVTDRQLRELPRIGSVDQRRQQVIPEPKPSSCGRNSHRIPVYSTNRIPHMTLRCSSRLRPG